jgi:hypothetical protein
MLVAKQAVEIRILNRQGKKGGGRAPSQVVEERCAFAVSIRQTTARLRMAAKGSDIATKPEVTWIEPAGNGCKVVFIHHATAGQIGEQAK